MHPQTLKNRVQVGLQNLHLPDRLQNPLVSLESPNFRMPVYAMTILASGVTKIVNLADSSSTATRLCDPGTLADFAGLIVSSCLELSRISMRSR